MKMEQKEEAKRRKKIRQKVYDAGISSVSG